MDEVVEKPANLHVMRNIIEEAIEYVEWPTYYKQIIINYL